MEKTVGIAELTSITYGIAASDAMLKAGQVRMLRSAPMCPGKYLIVIGGDTGEVKAAMEAGAELAGKHLRNSYVIPHIHEQVLDALSKKSKVEPREAVGILESSMMVSAIYAADMAVKQAAVRLCRVRLGQGIGGKGVVIVAGDVGAVNAAVKAATDDSGMTLLYMTDDTGKGDFFVYNSETEPGSGAARIHLSRCITVYPKRVMCVPAGEISRERKTEGKMGV